MKRVSQIVGLTALSLSIGLTGCQSIKNSSLFGGKKEITPTKAEKSEQGYFTTAQKNLDKGNYVEAIKNLTDLRTFFPVGQYSDKALLDLMYAQFQHGDYLDAVASSERFIQLYPTDPQVDYAYYVRGIANMSSGFTGVLKYTDLNQAHRDLGYSRLAFNNFQELIGRYPNSPYAPDVAQRMRYIYNQMAENEMDSARWYIKRKAYIAAANRAKWVFQYYPQSIQVPEAIATMAYSYDKLGMTDTASQYKQLLAINYPQLLDNKGGVKLSNALTKKSLLNTVTLGVLGRGAYNAKITPKVNTSIATKPQPIQTMQAMQSMQQAMAMRLPAGDATGNNGDNAANPVLAPVSNRVKVGLGLPDSVIDQTTSQSSNSNNVNQTMIENNAQPSKTPVANPSQSTLPNAAVTE